MRLLIALTIFVLSAPLFAKDGYPQRVITVAPHLAEMVIVAGGEDRLVGVSAFSGTQAILKKLPIISDARSIDLERIKTLKPDLILIWEMGTPATQQAALRKLFENTNTQIVPINPRNLNDIKKDILTIGKLLGTEVTANRAADDYDKKLSILKNRYQKPHVPPVKVFYQVWAQPLMTINRDHLIADIIKTCGAEQLFANEQLLVPTVSREAVAQANPDLIIAGIDNPQVKPDWSMWKNLKNLSVTKSNAFYEIESDIISKPGPRVLLGADKICQAVERTRQQKQTQ